MDDVVAVVTDLFFQARISSAARAAGRRVQFVSTLEQVSEVSSDAVILVDLDAAVDVAAAIRELKARGAARIVAFGPHLDIERRKAARAAGAGRVLAKSKFVVELPAILAEAAPSRP